MGELVLIGALALACFVLACFISGLRARVCALEIESERAANNIDALLQRIKEPAP